MCHQIPSRALGAGDFQMPLCARCAGLYAGFFLALPVLLLLGKKRRGVPKTSFMVFSCLLLAAFAAEAGGNLLGFWNGPGPLRFALGLFAAGVLSPYVALLFYGSLGEGGAATPIAGGGTALWIVAVVAALGGLNVRPPAALLAAESFAAAAGVVMLLAVAHVAVFVLILGRRRAVLAGALAPLTVTAQLALFSLLRGVMETFIVRLG